MRIIVVEDNEIVADAIVRTLIAADFVVDRVANTQAAQTMLAAERFDLLVLDIGLPGADGLTLVRRLRSAGDPIPALILTARDTLDEKVSALNIGADDFLAKPFEPAELIARCRALIRRAGVTRTGRINLGRLEIDLSGRQLCIDSQQVLLTAREWMVLECLVQHLGQIVSKEHLLQAISNFEQSVSLNAVEAYVSRLRSKLGEVAVIRSLRGLGYRLEEVKHP